MIFIKTAVLGALVQSVSICNKQIANRKPRSPSSRGCMRDLRMKLRGSNFRVFQVRSQQAENTGNWSRKKVTRIETLERTSCGATKKESRVPARERRPDEVVVGKPVVENRNHRLPLRVLVIRRLLLLLPSLHSLSHLLLLHLLLLVTVCIWFCASLPLLEFMPYSL